MPYILFCLFLFSEKFPDNLANLLQEEPAKDVDDTVSTYTQRIYVHELYLTL